MFCFKRHISKVVWVVLFFLLGSSSCKDNYESVIPYVYVNINASLSNIIELNVPMGAAYFNNSGYAGVIVYRDIDDNLYAFDAACTHEISSSCKVEVEEGTGSATCPCCGSKFQLFYGNGTVTQGPAIAPLKRYRAHESGGRLIVTN